MTTSHSSLTPAGKKRLLEQLAELSAAIESLPTLTPCELCDQFENGHCRTWKSTVPVEARAAGCAEWVERLPF